MTNSDVPTDPYQSPAYFADREEPSDAPPRRPGGLTAICVITLIFASLGLLITLFSLATLLAGDAMQNAFTPAPPPGLQDEMFEAQEEMQEALQVVARQYVVPSSVVLAFRFVVAIGLIVGAVKVLKLRPAGRVILFNVFLFAIVFELCRFGFQMYIEMQTMPIVEQYMSRLMESTAAQGPPGAPDPKEMTRFLMTVTKIIGFGGLVVFLLAKVIFYAIGASYLSKQKIKTLFGLADGNRSPYEPFHPTI